MEVEGTRLMKEIADHQFVILGIDTRFKDIPEDGMIEVGKKKVEWYHHYKFTEEQEKEWYDWIKEKTKDSPLEWKSMLYLDMRYGFVRRYR